MYGQPQPLVTVDGFSGPFDLLVRLIERRELDLLAISLAEVADQYLAHLSSVNLRDPEHLSAFLVVAAKLLLIKSTRLLPSRDRVQATDPAVVDPNDLVDRLRVYRAFRDVASALARRDDAGLRSYPHGPVAYRPSQPLPSTPLDLDRLREAYRAALARPRAEPETDLPVEARMTVAEAMTLLTTALDRSGQIVFTELFEAGAPRQRYVAAFLAVLELARLGLASVEQTERFGPIKLGRPATPPAESVLAADESAPDGGGA